MKHGRWKRRIASRSKLKSDRYAREPGDGTAEACPRCGRSFERLTDPLGRWLVCVRCGVATVLEAGSDEIKGGGHAEVSSVCVREGRQRHARGPSRLLHEVLGPIQGRCC